MRYSGENSRKCSKAASDQPGAATITLLVPVKRTGASGCRYGSTSQRVRYTYDGPGRVATRRVTNGSSDQTTTYSYMNSSVPIPGLSTLSSTYLVNGISQPNVSFSYTYDATTANIASEVRTNGSYAGTTSYVYDTLGQLIRVNDPKDTTSGSTGTTWTYEYDRGSNILTKKRYAYTTGTLGTATQIISYVYSDSNWKDKLTSYNGTALAYDAIGNLTSDGAWSYTWQAGRQLKQMSESDTTVVFDYDMSGMRASKTVGSSVTNYTYSGTNLTHLTKGADVMHFFYDGQGEPAIVKYNSVYYSYLYNLQGDVIGLVDSTGALVVEYKYDAWGKSLGKTGSLASTLGTLNPFRYRGYVYDEETGLYYLQSRYYNPTWGRFINADVLLGQVGALLSHNLFAYCINNPVLLLDPSGRDPSAMVLVQQYGMTVAQLDGFLPFLDVAVVAWAAGAWLSDAIGFTNWFVSAWQGSRGIIIDLETDHETDIYIEMPNADVGIDDGIAYAKGYQGNMRDSELRDIDNETLERLLKDPNISAEQKRRYQREQKARGLRNKKKREGYHHFTLNVHE